MVMTVSGVMPVLATPFTQDEDLDLASLRALVAHVIGSGADAVVAFGLASELYKLDDRDRAEVLELIIDSAGGRVPVIAGVEHSGTRAAVRRAQQAAAAGASAVMAYPPTFVKPSAVDVEHYFRALASAGLPVIVQDAPSWTGVDLPVDLLARISAAEAGVTAVKLELPPIGAKAAALRDAGLAVITGFGGVHLAEDLECQPLGIMPGCATPELFVRIWREHQAGRRDLATAMALRAQPYLVAQLTSLDVFIEATKRLLVEGGVISTAAVRRPHQPIPDSRWEWMRELHATCGLDAFLPGHQR